jgi:3-deoxy-D-manno-octulosonic-acid transferase
VYTELSVAGGLTSVGDGQALGEAVVRLFGNSDERAALSAAGMRVLDANRGAVARLMGILRPVFKPDPET